MKAMYNDRFYCKVYATITRESVCGIPQSGELNINWDCLLEFDSEIDEAIRCRAELGRIVDVRRNTIYCNVDIDRAYKVLDTTGAKESEPFLYMIETVDIVFETEEKERVKKDPKEEHPDIWAAVGAKGKSFYKINKKFGCTAKELTNMGFYVDRNKNVYRSKRER